MNTIDSFLNQTNEKKTEEYSTFYHQNRLFQRYVNDRESLLPDEMDEMKTDFENQFSDKNYDDFLIENGLGPEGICSSTPIYDTKNKKTVNPTILSPFRQKTSSFNIHEFLKEAIANNQMFYLNFDLDPDLELETGFEEKNKQIILAHQSLKGIGELALCLNKQRKEVPYTLMDVKAENYVH